MIKKKFLIKNKIGLHARPASSFVDLASKFKSKVKIVFEDTEVNAKSIISVLSLGLGKGDKFTLIIKGTDEKKAMNKLEQFIKNNLREKESQDDII